MQLLSYRTYLAMGLLVWASSLFAQDSVEIIPHDPVEQFQYESWGIEPNYAVDALGTELAPESKRIARKEQLSLSLGLINHTINVARNHQFLGSFALPGPVVSLNFYYAKTGERMVPIFIIATRSSVEAYLIEDKAVRRITLDSRKTPAIPGVFEYEITDVTPLTESSYAITAQKKGLPQSTIALPSTSLEAILASFNLDEPKDLKGRVILSAALTPTVALELQRIIGAKEEFPTYTSVYNLLLQSLIKCELPDLLLIDQRTSTDALKAAFKSGKSWLQLLSSRIRLTSDGMTELMPISLEQDFWKLQLQCKTQAKELAFKWTAEGSFSQVR